jgi:hypothetical protein
VGLHDRAGLLRRAYALFNERRIDELLALMTEDVEWPDVARAVVLRGKDSIGSYWRGQFAAASPIVVPERFVEVDDDLVAVVDQRVDDLVGRPIVPPRVVYHRFSFERDLVRRMVVHTDEATAVRS